MSDEIVSAATVQATVQATENNMRALVLQESTKSAARHTMLKQLVIKLAVVNAILTIALFIISKLH